MLIFDQIMVGSDLLSMHNGEITEVNLEVHLTLVLDHIGVRNGHVETLMCGLQKIIKSHKWMKTLKMSQ